jgi:hypothetical protein
MEQWQYNAVILYADAGKDAAKQDMARRWPTWKPSKYAPQALLHELDEYGKDGWELISIENVVAGGNADIAHPHGGPGAWAYSNAYLAFFKRRVEGGR